MKILKHDDTYARQLRNITAAETSNIAMVVQSNQVFPTYYSINADLSTLVNGFDNTYEYIGEGSSVVYDKIEKLPMSGVDNLVMSSEYDDDLSYDVDFSSQGIIYPNTIIPKPGDMFIFPDSLRTSIFVVTNAVNVVVRSNPFVEITFKLFSQSKEDLIQLNKQVKDEYKVTVCALGSDKTLVIKKKAYFEIKEHIQNYIDIATFYTDTFYDKSRACFMFEGFHDTNTVNTKVEVIDCMLWKLMFTRGIIVYDNIINYALSNYDMPFKRVYIDSPFITSDHEFKTSIFERLLSKNRKKPFFEKRFPAAYEENSQISKFHGANILYIERYRNVRDCNQLIGNFTIFDDEFIDRILYDAPYEENTSLINASLRNVIIAHFNDHEIEFEAVDILDEKTIENYYLIPMVLDIYKSYIVPMQFN